mgnify:CR=1 FL=1
MTRPCSYVPPSSPAIALRALPSSSSRSQTVVVEPHWQAEVTASNHLLLTRASARETRAALGTNVDPVLLEVFNKRFTAAIAEQMGYALQNTARSVNIKGAARLLLRHFRS